MEDSFTALDLIILVFTVFIGYRLYMVLGRRTGPEKKPADTIIFPGSQEAHPLVDDLPLATNVKKIMLKDRTFSPSVFLEGSKKAFEMILNAFLEGDAKTLKGLTTPKMYALFKVMMDNRRTKKQVAELLYFRLVSGEILESDLVDNRAVITVKFKSEQTLLIKEGDKIVEGDPDFVDEVTDLWVFSREINAAAPIWFLEQIQDAGTP